MGRLRHAILVWLAWAGLDKILGASCTKHSLNTALVIIVIGMLIGMLINVIGMLTLLPFEPQHEAHCASRLPPLHPLVA